MKELRKDSEMDKEILDPKSVVIATSTWYPNWTEKENSELNPSVALRGRLALETIKQSTEKGYQVIIVDGGSGEEFVNRASELGAIVLSQTDKGMSPGRRQTFREASKLEGCKIICWLEPEKISIVSECLLEALKPILSGDADIVIPKRTEEGFATYPDYQVKYEKMMNTKWNKLIKKYGLLSKEDEELDVCLGPRFFRNDLKLVSLFLARYEFDKESPQFLKDIKPEDWSNATFLPIAAALYEGYKVKSVIVPYHHPPEQTMLEKDDKQFRKKRVYQLKSIIATTSEFLKLVSNQKTYLHKEE